MYNAYVVSILLKGVDKLIVWDVFLFFGKGRMTMHKFIKSRVLGISVMKM